MSAFAKKNDAPDLGNITAPAAATETPLAVPPELLSPQAAAYVNTLVSRAVQEALAAAMKANAPTTGLTSEGLVAALTEAERLRRVPTETEVAKLKRQQREKRQMHEEQELNRRNLALVQENCGHRYPSNALAVAIINNFHDRNPRFVCLKCHLLIEPRRWSVGEFPSEEHPKGHDRIVDAHPLWASMAKEYATTHQQ
jgi:hypothetical protein